MKPYKIADVAPDISFLEMLDQLNNRLIVEGQEPIEFDSDCREGICGTCGLVINGIAHGPKGATATCEVRMRQFADGSTITVEPFRAAAFPVVKDLVVDRSSFDRIVSRGAYISVNAGSAAEANSILVSKDQADASMDAAACISCGACVAACPNASASLFMSAQVSRFALLPQGQPERHRRVAQLVEQMDKEGFGDCSNHGECEAVCPKSISIENIARMRREFVRSMAVGSRQSAGDGE